MNYWLFTVMYDQFPTLWPALLRHGVAAQQYPAGWTNEIKNFNALQKVRKGDGIIAAFMSHRFAGYGFLKSDFARRGQSLQIMRDDEHLPFQERADIDWTALPVDATIPYVQCRDLKAEGYDLDLLRGLCVKKIDQRTFEKVRQTLDREGAIPFISQQRHSVRPADVDSVLPEEVEQGDRLVEGAVRVIEVNAYERNPVAREKCLAAHGTACCICGLEFGEIYGSEADGYIHVHHLKPISEIGHEYEVDPVEDLRPVCPNCHAVLHLGRQCRTIEQVRGLLDRDLR